MKEQLVKAEMKGILDDQKKEIAIRLNAMSKGNLIRVVKALSGLYGEQLNLQTTEIDFIKKLVNSQENYMAAVGLANEDLQQGEKDE